MIKYIVEVECDVCHGTGKSNFTTFNTEIKHNCGKCGGVGKIIIRRKIYNE